MDHTAHMTVRVAKFPAPPIADRVATHAILQVAKRPSAKAAKSPARPITAQVAIRATRRITDPSIDADESEPRLGLIGATHDARH
jgi:hypothetical protein